MDNLVPALANKYRGGIIEWDDLLQFGRVGLTRAAERFDPNRGNQELEFEDRFTNYASGGIVQEIRNAIQSEQSKHITTEDDDDAIREPIVGDHIESIYDWDAWGEFGNATAICEIWSNLDASPEDLAIRFEDIKGKRDQFRDAFKSLTGNQRKMVTMVFLREQPLSVEQAAREMGCSYFQATRILKRGLGIMREEITRMEHNKTNTQRATPTSPLPLSAFTAALSG